MNIPTRHTQFLQEQLTSFPELTEEQLRSLWVLFEHTYTVAHWEGKWEVREEQKKTRVVTG